MSISRKLIRLLRSHWTMLICKKNGFIAKYGSKEYFRHNKDLLLYERQGEIEDALKDLKLN